MTAVRPLRGVFPIAPTLFSESGEIFENRQCGLRATKAIMMAGGVIGSDATRHPTEPLPAPTRVALLELAHEVGPLALRRGH
jgi:2-keto-3-deoxy-L-arabinonate dehydratase